MTLRLLIKTLAIALTLRCLATSAIADPIQITVHSESVIQPTNTLRSGICIEDINHEIYGGLYSQMIYGESFQEPPSPMLIKGFNAYGGSWTAKDGIAQIDGNDGPKLVSDRPVAADTTVGVELQFADNAGENAGLIVRATGAKVGPDSFIGYEVSLDPGHQTVRLARHRNNYDLISDTPCALPPGKWISLQVKLNGSVIGIIVDGKSVTEFDDHDNSIANGTVGLRAWRCKASFRKLSIQTNGQPETLPFDPADAAGDVSRLWKPVVNGSAVGRFALDHQSPFTGSQSQIVSFESGDGEVGIENRGVDHWGMNYTGGKPYEGSVWVKAEHAAKLVAALENADGSHTYAEQSLDISAGDWQKLDLSLTPSGDDHNGRFTLILKQPGSVTVGYAFLQPGEWGRYKGLPLRRDIVEGIIDQGVSVMRYGGSMANSPEYRWKKMIGPRDRRPPYQGTWYRYSSNGWGAIDFINLCEATGIEGIPDLNSNETPQDMADFIEYVNGSADSEWGKRRAADGHPEPYHLKHLELGNEEKVDSVFSAKFNALAEAIWEKDPDIILVVGDFGYRHKISDPDHITDTDGGLTNMDGQRQILKFAAQHNREVWFDVHVWSEYLDPSLNLLTLPSYIDAIDQISDGAKHRVVVFELNAMSHGQMRALANAVSINTARRDNRMPVVISANGLQADGENDNGWDQGLLFFNPWKVWLQGPGYVTQMQARNEQPLLVKCDVDSSESARLDVTATRSEDGKTLVLQVINTKAGQIASLALGTFLPARPTAHVTELAGGLNDVNTADKPATIVSKESDWQFDLAGGKILREFQPHSFTIIRFEK